MYYNGKKIIGFSIGGSNGSGCNCDATKITELEKEVDNLEARTTALETDVDSLETKTDALEKKATSLETDVDSLETKTTTLERSAVSLEERTTALEAGETGGGKIKATVNCPHEIEYTGYGQSDCNLAVEDQQMLITKIQGQTRTKSPNLFNQEAVLPSIGMTKQSDGSFNISNVAALNGKIIWTNNTNSSRFRILIDILEDINIGVAFTFVYSDGTSETLWQQTYGSYNTFAFVSNVNKTLSQIKTTFVNGGINTSFKNFAIYEDTSIGYYIAYDNSSLVNSKCNLISTGRNLIDWTKVTKGFYLDYTNGNSISLASNAETDYIRVISGSSYYFMNGNGVATHICFYDANKNFVSGVLKVGSFTIPYGVCYTRVTVATNAENTARLFYGSSDLGYEHYIEDKLNIDIELGQYDYIDVVSGKQITQTAFADLGTLNWTMADNGIFSATPSFAYTPDVGVCGKYTLVPTQALEDVTDKTIQLRNTNIIYVKDSSYTTLAAFKASLNGVKLAYKSTTTTVTDVMLPSGMNIYKGGMQIQDGTVPYKITKQYAISLSQQVLHNVEIDRNQQEQLNRVNQRIDELPTYKPAYRVAEASGDWSTATGYNDLYYSHYLNTKKYFRVTVKVGSNLYNTTLIAQNNSYSVITFNNSTLATVSVVAGYLQVTGTDASIMAVDIFEV